MRVRWPNKAEPIGGWARLAHLAGVLALLVNLTASILPSHPIVGERERALLALGYDLDDICASAPADQQPNDLHKSSCQHCTAPSCQMGGVALPVRTAVLLPPEGIRVHDHAARAPPPATGYSFRFTARGPPTLV